MPSGALSASGETRTLSLHHVHTGEKLQVTYMVNGRYLPSAMKQINRLLRDWRRNEVIRIDPKTIDLMWELHTDLGSRAPIRIISGYRSPRTNAFLKRIGRKVARKSQHMSGRAIDLYFPDVATEKVRNSALVRRVGGVGYYRGRNGFVHIDSGNVRHWPRMPHSKLAKIMRDYRATVGRRLNRGNLKVIASQETRDAKPEKVAPSLYDTPDEDEDENSVETGDAKSRKLAKDAPVPRRKPDLPVEKIEEPAPQVVALADDAALRAFPVPKPRSKPIEILFQDALNMQIEPASAPPEGQPVKRNAKPAADVLDVIVATAEEDEPAVNASGKSGLALPKRDKAKPAIRQIEASAAGEDLFWVPKSQNEEPPVEPLKKKSRSAKRKAAAQPIAEVQVESSGKADMLMVNRSGKGDLEAPLPVKRKKIGQLN